MSGTALLTVQGLTIRYGAVAALDGLDLTVQPGELFVLLGASGSGKSTLLRAIAGFVRPDAGRILLDGTDLAPLPAHRRPVNTMFQSYALFPHLTVAENIAFGPRQRGMSRTRAAALVTEMLALVRLEGMGGRRPHQLSGGQQQRVALARALAAGPRLLLLDEPLSALDRALRAETRDELMRLNRRTGTSFILVTHDQEEALTMADRIGIMQHGRLAQVGTPAAVYETPVSRFVAGFIGSANLLAGRVGADGGSFAPEGIGTALVLPHPSADMAGAPAWLAIRPERLRIGPGPHANALDATVTDRAYAGDSLVLTLRLTNDAVLRVRQPLTDGLGAAAIQPGDSVRVGWPAEAGVLLRT